MTVVIPVWGAYVHKLPDALASIRGQDLPVRIIVVDNASQVPLPRLNDDQLRIVRRGTRLSAGAARNLGLAHVETPYVLFWDADDTMLPGTLRLLRDSISSDSELACSATSVLESVSGPRHRWPRPWTFGLARWRRAFAAANCVWPLFPTTGSAILPTALVRDAGGYADLNRGEDALLGASLAFRGRVGFSNLPGRVYSQHGRSLSASALSTREILEQRRAVRRRIREDPGIPASFKAFLPAIAILQYLAIFVVRPAFRLVRFLRRLAQR